MTDPLDRVLSALRQHGCDPRQSGPNQYVARCPVHQGDRHNLSVCMGDSGVLLYCHHVDGAGHPSCSVADIAGALGLEMRDLFKSNGPGPTPRVTIGRPKSSVKVYPTWMDAADSVEKLIHGAKRTGDWAYAGANGHTVMVVVRFDKPDGKEYRPFSPCEGGWKVGAPTGKLPLYDLPTVATNIGEYVYIVEGEKCAATLGKYMPCVTTSAFGAGKASKTDWSPLAGQCVTILPDNDGPGEGHVKSVLAELARLSPHPTSVRVVRLPGLPEGGDVADWLPVVVGDRTGQEATGAVRLDLRTLVAQAPEERLDTPAVVTVVSLSCAPSGGIYPE